MSTVPDPQYFHPLRARLRRTGIASFVRARPWLYRLAVSTWQFLRAVKNSILRLPLTIHLPLLSALFVLGLLPPRRPVAAPGKREGLEIVMLVISEVFRDPRVEREARALAAAGFRVKLLYPDYFSAHHKVGALDWGPNVSFRPLPHYMSAYIFGFPYVLGFGFLKEAIRERPFAFHAHDLSTALVGLAAARFTGAHCVCDFHEWYSENVTWDEVTKTYAAHPRRVQAVYRMAERAVLHRATAVVTVCESIARELKAMCSNRREILVVRNVPSVVGARGGSSGPDLRQELGIAPNQFVLLYQGGTGPTRLLEPVIEAMVHAPRAVLVIRGPGIEYYGPGYLELAASLGIDDRIFCLAPVKSDQVVVAASGADAGLWTLPNLCKNFSYALPNKLFEYLAAGLPVLVADYPEVARLTNDYGVGLTFDPYSPESIAACVNELIDCPDIRKRMAANAREALIDMRTDREWQKLVRLYVELAEGRTPPTAEGIADLPRAGV